MAPDLRQILKLTQQLVMTPQLQQAIKLLQMSRLELVETIREEMETNPTLEETVDREELQSPNLLEEQKKEKVLGDLTEEVSSTRASEREIDWEQYLESYGASDYATGSYEKAEAVSYDNIIRSKETLADHLRWQLMMSDLDEREREIGDFIIGNIDEDGYLDATLEEVAETMGCEVDEAGEVLNTIQGFDPIGVAARNLRECLLIQARHLCLEDGLVGYIISNHLADIEKRKLSVIAREAGASMEEVTAAVKIISGMEPRPGRPFTEENTRYVLPDLYVYKLGDEYVITLNEDGIPRLKISNYYREMLERGGNRDETRKYIQEKVRSAMWLIKSIQQRQRTIYKVMESILKFQRDFFDKGVEHLKPLVLKTVADDVGMHESTISRVTNNKYVHTPHGIFELKYFFSSAISRFDAEDIASESVKEKIRQLIAAEDHSKPLSDQAIVNLLKESDINIARRTVTKYREMMGIPSSSKRKRLF